MKKTVFLFSTLALLFAQSCVAPVNLQFDSATMLEAGESEIQTSGSAYYYIDDGDADLTNVNFGYKVGYGFTEKYNLKFRQEFLFVDQEKVSVFSELDNKFKLHKNFALSFPAGYYTNAEVVAVTPRLYCTVYPSKKVDLTLMSKLNYQLDLQTNESYLYPSFSLGLGFISKNQQWSFRPEIGWEFYSCYGFAITKKFNRPRFFRK